MTNSCPPKHTPEYKLIESIFGEGKADGLWTSNGEVMLTPTQAIKMLYGKLVNVNDALKTWDLGNAEGKKEKGYRDMIDRHIIETPTKALPGGESFDTFKKRALTEFARLLDTAPANTMLVTHSAVIKLFKLWNDAGRPADFKIDNAGYTKLQTTTGEIDKFQGKNGPIWVARHGETFDNAQARVRSNDTMLTKKGIKQAERTATELSGIYTPIVHVSSLDRAIHTADHILDAQIERENAARSLVTPKELTNIIVNSDLGRGLSEVKDSYGNFLGYTTGTEQGNRKWLANAKEWLQNKRYFTDLKIVVNDRTGNINFLDKNRDIEGNIPKKDKLLQVESDKKAPVAALDEKVKSFVKVLKGQIRSVDKIVVEGKVVNAVAVANVIDRTIDYVEGKAGLDTLPEEAAHLFVQWLPAKSPLLRDMMKDIADRDIYDKTVEQYKDNPLYQNADGSIDEEKMKIEAIGKMIAQAIIGKFEDSQSKNLWKRLVEWLKSIFTGKTPVSAYQQAAGEILEGKTSSLDMEAINKQETKTLKYGLQSIIARANEGNLKRSPLQTAFNVTRSVEGTSGDAQTQGTNKEKQYWEAYKQAGLEYTGKLGQEQYIAQGQEHMVYGTANDTVIKVRKNIDDPEQISDYLKELLAHNYLFPDVPYTFLGFIERDGRIMPVVEQPVINDSEDDKSYNKATISKYLEKLGFYPTDEDLVYENPEIGTIEDLHGGNVIFKGDVLYFIDPIITLKNSIKYPENDKKFQELKNIPVTDNIKTDKDELQQIFSGADREPGNIQKALNFFRNSDSTVSTAAEGSTRKAGSGIFVPGESSGKESKGAGKSSPELIKYIKANNLEYDIANLPSEETLDEGNEQDVYLDTKNSTVVKVNHGGAFDSWKDYLNNLLVHNYYFPEVAYKLLGFTTENGIVQAVVEQPYVKGEAVTDREKIDTILATLNFAPKKGEVGTYYNKDLDVTLDDIHGGNILEANGVLFPIDTRFYIGNKFYGTKEFSSAQDANAKGKYFFQLSDDQKELVKHYNKEANPLQKQLMKEMFINPTDKLTLEPKEHIYEDNDIQNPTKYTSVTTAIGGKWTEEQEKEYKINADWGTDIDAIMQGVILNKPISEIDTPNLPDSVKQKAFTLLAKIVGKLTADGSIIIPQAIIGNKQEGIPGARPIAGSIDILTISPTGQVRIVDLKSSWSSVDSEGYRNTAYDRGAGAWIDTKLTKNQSQGLQVQCYRKLMELEGFPDIETSTWHMLLTVKDGKVVDVKDEGEVKHLPTEYKDLVDKMIPATTKRNRLNELLEEHGIGNPTHSQEFKDDMDKEEQIVPKEKVYDIYKAATSWREYVDRIKDVAGFKAGNQSTEKIIALLAAMQSEIEESAAKATRTGKGTENIYSTAYTEFLKYANAELNAINNYIGNKNYMKSPDYIRIVRYAKDYLNTFRGVMGTEKFANSKQKAMLYELQTNLKATDDALLEAYKQSVINNILTRHTTNQAVKDNAIDFVTRSMDIDDVSFFVGDIANSGVSVIENADKAIKHASEQVRENTEAIQEKVRTLGNALIAANGGKKDSSIYDIFFQKDAKGRRTGRIVSQLGMNYWNLRNKVEAPLYNVDGSPRTYIENPTTDEEKRKNIELWYLKQARKDFVQSEKNGYTVDENGLKEPYSEQGDYHRLTDEFIAERAKYMKQNSFGRWVPKENNNAFLQFQKKYYVFTEYNKMIMDKKGNPTGITEKVWDHFPMPQYVVARDIAEDGTDMRDATYKMLTGNEPKSALQQAQSDFYKGYRDILQEQVEKLPPSAMTWFKRGYIPTLRSNFMTMISQGKVGVLEAVGAEMRDFFSISAYTNQNALTETGTNGQTIPIMFMGAIQDQERLNKIESQLGELAMNKSKMPLAEFNKKYAELSELKKKESARVTGEQIAPDLTEGLMAFAKMSENYHIMSGIEDQLLAVKQVLSEMEFERNGKKVKGVESNAYKRFAEYMEMCFYYDNQHNKDLPDILAKRLKNITSIMAIPFKIFGGVNNAIIATINNNLDSYGGDFYDTRAIRRMSGVYISEFMPGYLSTWTDHTLNKNKYAEKKAGSKFEALSHKFNMVEHYQESQGKVNILGQTITKLAYGLQEGGEFMVQSKIGNAILDSVQMGEVKIDMTTGEMKLTGKTLSVYDAHTFDGNTGHSHVSEKTDGNIKTTYMYLNKDGSIADDQKKEQYALHNRIRETNKRIHGNYRPIDKTYIEKYWVGQFAMQFHKWVVPYFMARFRKGKFDENLGGGMHIEGRWRSIVALRKAIKDTASLTAAWENLTDHQKNNLKKDLGDLVYLGTLISIGVIVKALAAGIPDDDPYLKKFANWLQYESDRAFQEVAIAVPVVGLIESYNLVKNPFAATSALQNLSEVIKTTAAIPYYMATDQMDKAYIEKGVHKGELHMWKELKDVIPILNNINQFEMLDTKKNFYIP